MRIATLWGVIFLSVTGCAYGVTTGSDDDDVHLDYVPRPAATTSSGTGGATSSSSSSTSSTSSSSSSTSSTSSSGGVCDNQGDCYDCANCSIGAECSGPMNTCMNDTDCMDFMDCMAVCTEQTCMDGCAASYPTGAMLYVDLTDCAFCVACPVDCVNDNQGMCY